MGVEPGDRRFAIGTVGGWVIFGFGLAAAAVGALAMPELLGNPALGGRFQHLPILFVVSGLAASAAGLTAVIRGRRRR